MDNNQIIIALDFDLCDQARDLLHQLDPSKCRVKIGKAMFTRYGPEWVKEVMALGFDVFLDLKFHDIPQQVVGACKAAADLGVWMLTVHALGGKRMLEAAAATLRSFGNTRPLLMAVTVLTSHTNDELSQIGIQACVQDEVLQLAKLSEQSQCDGVICSAQEAPLLRQSVSDNFLLVTPGIRLQATMTNNDDQRRIVTPNEAVNAGSNYLVIGRPITQAVDPKRILAEICMDIK